MADAAQKKSRYFSASSLLFAARIVGAAAMFGAQVLLARKTSADTLALFFLATSLVTVAGTVATLGHPYIMARILGRYQDPRHAERANAFISVSRTDAVVTATFIGLVLAGAIAAYPYATWSERACFLVALPAIPAIALSRTNGALGRVRKRLATAYLPTIFWRPLLFLAAALVAVIVLQAVDAVVLTGLFAAIAIIAAASQAYNLRHEARTPAADTDKRLSRRWRRTAIPFIVISAVELLFVDVELMLAGTLLAREKLAVFAICLKLAFFAGFIVDVLYELVSPELGRCYARRDMAALQRNVRLSNLSATAMTIVMMLGAVAFSRTALGLFGPDYVAGEWALITLVAVPMVNALAGPHVALLTLKGAQRQMNYAYAVGGAALVALNVTLAPILGVLGAALAVLGAFIGLNLILATTVWRLMGLRSDAFHLIPLLGTRFHQVSKCCPGAVAPVNGETGPKTSVAQGGPASVGLVR